MKLQETQRYNFNYNKKIKEGRNYENLRMASQMKGLA